MPLFSRSIMVILLTLSLLARVCGLPVSVAVKNLGGEFTPLFDPVGLGDKGAPADSQSASPSSTLAPIETVTLIVTAVITPPPTTLVSWVTAAPNSSPTPSTTAVISSLPTPQPAPTAPPASSPTGSPRTLRSWSLGPQFTDLSCFKVQKYAGGETNVRIVTGIPSTASITVPSGPQSTPSSSLGKTSWNNATDNAMELFYPKGSVNPGNKPQGGSDFYATPIPLNGATNVTMEYSVFMDANMEFVKGGKLPGLYGGHQGCSGGNVADTCFSTRLMWRPGGAGELYLYADKTKQLPSLCQTPNASCNEVYGLSLGRGSFIFARGEWNDLRQTVRLNTPGIPDGGFTLDVNGRRVLTLEGIYYRDSKSSPSASSSSSVMNQWSKTTSPMAASTTSQGSPPTAVASIPPEMSDIPPMTSTDLPPLLGGILGGLGDLLGGTLSSKDVAPIHDGLFGHKRSVKEISLLHRRHQRQRKGYAMKTGPVELIAPRSFRVPNGKTQPLASLRARFTDVAVPTGVQDVADSSSASPSPLSYASSGAASAPSESFGPAMLATNPQAAFGFTGIFFSTFFGGHDSSWATPKDQYIWFKGFALTINR